MPARRSLPHTALTPAERSLRASIAANTRWSRADKTERSRVAQAGCDALLESFAKQVDPDRSLEPAERAKRARYAYTAHMQRLSLASARARRVRAAGEAA